MTTNTQQLRQQFKQQRAKLTAPFVIYCSRQMCAKIARSKIFQASQHIGIYYSQNGEIDPSHLIELARRSQKSLYLPVISPQANSLQFRYFGAKTRLRRNKFGIPEPLPIRGKMPLQQLDLVLTPLVAFTHGGQRLGMGKGYYDRTFAHRNRPGNSKHPFLLGCAYEWQKVPSLPAQPWDVNMDGVVTEKTWYGRRR